jgi:aryl-alcohol dehydrogenase-like predicted oxidoreductase
MESTTLDVPPSPRLALGTAQFGLPYGRGHQRSPIDRAEVGKILRVASLAGIDTLDTAVSYGDAESIIGEMRPSDAHFDIISKIQRFEDRSNGPAHIGRLAASVYSSRAKLGVNTLDGLLVHHAPELLGPNGADLFGCLLQLKAEGIVRRIGVSVYDPETLSAILDRYPIEIVQLPLNVLDQRFARAGIIEALGRVGIEVHVRSVFLQGVLLGDSASLFEPFCSVRDVISQFHQKATNDGFSPVSAALSFVAQCKGVARIIIGVEGVDHLREGIAAFEMARANAFDASELSIDDLEIIDPRRWPSH